MAESSPPEVQELEQHTDAAREWRCARYEEMGFTPSESLALAVAIQTGYTGTKDARLKWETPLDWKKVKAALDSGCTQVQALEIFL